MDDATTPGGQVAVGRDAAIATITLSHPGKLNALSVAMWVALGEAVVSLGQDADVRCVVIRGADGNFAAGADIAEFPAARGSAEGVYHYHEAVLAPTLRAIAHCPHPTVALIEGVCVGGGLEIAGACDLRIAGVSARFGVPINRLGFPMAPGELEGLLALVGRATALELLLEGRILGAGEALAKGLVTRVAPDSEVEAEAYGCAHRIARGAPIAARINKQTIRRLSPAPAPLSEAELRAFFSYWDTFDHQEGIATFLAKRAPGFENR